MLVAEETEEYHTSVGVSGVVVVLSSTGTYVGITISFGALELKQTKRKKWKFGRVKRSRT